MTTPSLPPDGGTPRPPRDWLESLCERQPDGTWLVQAPPQQWQKPRFHLLPDDRSKDKYVAQLSRLMQADVALHIITSTPAMVLLFSSPLLLSNMLRITLPSATLAADLIGFVPGLVFLVLPLILGIVRRQRRSRLAAWLGDVASTPGTGSTTTPMTVRTAQDWEAVVESSGLRSQRILTLWLFALTLPILAVGAATYLNFCRGGAMLDPLFPAGAREQFRAEWQCKPLLWSLRFSLFVTIALVPAGVFLQRWVARRRRAGTARAVPVDRAA